MSLLAESKIYISLRGCSVNVQMLSLSTVPEKEFNISSSALLAITWLASVNCFGTKQRIQRRVTKLTKDGKKKYIVDESSSWLPELTSKHEKM